MPFDFFILDLPVLRLTVGHGTTIFLDPDFDALCRSEKKWNWKFHLYLKNELLLVMDINQQTVQNMKD